VKIFSRTGITSYFFKSIKTLVYDIVYHAYVLNTGLAM